MALREERLKQKYRKEESKEESKRNEAGSQKVFGVGRENRKVREQVKIQQNLRPAELLS